MSATCLDRLSPQVGEQLPRVLLVDDSATARYGLLIFLRSVSSIQIVGEAVDGPEGLAMAALLQPDLVITDLQMPGFDGLQLVKQLRSDYPSIRSIVVSANEGPAWKRLSLTHGADGFISKRYIPEELPGLLERLFPGVCEKTQSKERA